MSDLLSRTKLMPRCTGVDDVEEEESGAVGIPVSSSLTSQDRIIVRQAACRPLELVNERFARPHAQSSACST